DSKARKTYSQYQSAETDFGAWHRLVFEPFIAEGSVYVLRYFHPVNTLSACALHFFYTAVKRLIFCGFPSEGFFRLCQISTNYVQIKLSCIAPAPLPRTRTAPARNNHKKNN
ncbi:MAG: hypothetical protein EBV03_08850, partial [Proteobacteria bacterium]|nr:hypothetical protein [Pseudomonadota bacterium]